VRLTLAVSSRGERMRAGGLLDCEVMGLVVSPATRAPDRIHAPLQDRRPDVGHVKASLLASGLAVASGHRLRRGRRADPESLVGARSYCPSALRDAPIFIAMPTFAALTA
jgi:hypothetical protein